MDEYRVRITSGDFIESTRCTPLSEALARGQVRDSIVLSESGHMALKAAGIEDYSRVNIPVGTQPLSVEFTSCDNDNDTFIDTISRPVVSMCPMQDCSRCILNMVPEEQSGDTTILQDLQWSGYINYDKYL